MSEQDCRCSMPPIPPMASIPSMFTAFVDRYVGILHKPKDLVQTPDAVGPNEAYVMDDRMYVGTKNALADRTAISYPTESWSLTETREWWNTHQTEWISQQGQWSGSLPVDLEDTLFSQERLVQGVSVCVWKVPNLLAVPTIVYIPGTGFGTGGSYNDLANKNYLIRLAALGKCIVIAVDTSPIGVRSFVTAVNECAAVVQALANGNVARVRGGPVVLAGNSTGGTLALSTAIKAKREGWIDKICGIYSICPMVEAVASGRKYPSMTEFDGYAMWKGYLQACVNMVQDEQISNKKLFPLDASKDELMGLPPTKIIVYQLDMLRDMGIAMHFKLMKAGVPASFNIISGSVHDQQLYTLHSPEVTSASIHDLAQFTHYAATACGIDFKAQIQEAAPSAAAAAAAANENKKTTVDADDRTVKSGRSVNSKAVKSTKALAAQNATASKKALVKADRSKAAATKQASAKRK